MPNYSLVINSRFNPFTYQELMAPVQQATEAHKDLEDKYGELAFKADAWKDAAMRDPNSKVAKMYTQYSRDLDAQAKSLAAEGLTPSSRQSMLDIYRRYNSEITPIETAYNNRQADIKRQRDMYDKDETLMWNKDASFASLDDYLGGNMPDYQHVSGETLRSQVSLAAKNLAKEARGGSENARRKLQGLLMPSVYDAVEQTGFSYNEVMKAINDVADSPQVLNELVEDVVNQSGIKSWNDPELTTRAYGYARRGLYDAIGETKFSTVNAPSGGGGKNPSDLGSLFPINPTPLYSPKEEEQNKIYRDALKQKTKFEKYFDSEGNITDKGYEEYLKKSTSGYSGISYRSELWEFMSKLNGTYTSDGRITSESNDKDLTKAEINKLWNSKQSPVNAIPPEDAYKRVEYTFNPTLSESSNILNKLFSAGNNDLSEVEYNPESGVYEDTGRYVNRSSTVNSSNNFNASISNISFSSHGIVCGIDLANGDHKKVRIPRGTNTSAEDALNNNITIIDLLAKAINTKKRIDNYGGYIDVSDINASPEELSEYASKLKDFQIAAHGNLITLINTYDIKTESVSGN